MERYFNKMKSYIETDDKSYIETDDKSYKLRPPIKIGKISATMGVFFIIVSIYFLGYLYTDKNKTPNAFVLNENDGGYKDYSVSNAVGNGQKEAISVLVFLMLISILISIHAREGRFLIARYILITIVSILLILIVYINPLRLDINDSEKYNNAHMGLAVVAFLLNAIYIGLTYSVLKLTYDKDTKWYKSFFYYLVGLNVFFFLFCLSCAFAGIEEIEKK